MPDSVQGSFRDGRIELLDSPPSDAGDRVLVTFLLIEKGRVHLRSRGLGPHDATDLRRRLATFEDDWNRPEMDLYDAL